MLTGYFFFAFGFDSPFLGNGFFRNGFFCSNFFLGRYSWLFCSWFSLSGFGLFHQIGAHHFQLMRFIHIHAGFSIGPDNGAALDTNPLADARPQNPEALPAE